MMIGLMKKTNTNIDFEVFVGGRAMEESEEIEE